MTLYFQSSFTARVISIVQSRIFGSNTEPMSNWSPETAPTLDAPICLAEVGVDGRMACGMPSNTATRKISDGEGFDGSAA